jgi:hypothetical protein
MIEVGNKLLSDADCKYVLSNNARSGDDGQILITKSIYEKLDWTWTTEPKEVEVVLLKTNIISAFKFAMVYGQKYLYHKGKQIIFDNHWYDNQSRIIESHFGDSDVAYYKLNISLSTGNRHYVNSFSQKSGLNLQEFLISKYSSLVFKKQDNEIFIEINQDQKNLRGFCFSVFKILVREFGDEFLKHNTELVKTKIGQFNYNGVVLKDYFNNSKLLGIFESGQSDKVIKSKKDRFRYQKEPLKLLYKDKEVYFTTEFEFTRSNKSHILFNDFKNFVEKYSNNKYSILKAIDGKYQFIGSKQSNIEMKPLQKIFFGPPGSGKSHRIKTEFPGKWPRITFHPELDYQGFIGAYKPFVINTSNGIDQITYRFVEEAFLRAYCEAWKSDEPYYLIIEEINRGNCAQIFGDIFQLLDRNEEGYSEYPINCSPDIAKHLSEELSNMNRLEQYKKFAECEGFTRMSIPNNLNILCTMNTSDQSLFPMDSAFKRRWEWQYIPINYEDADKFTIELDKKSVYKWGEFIKEINRKIKDHTQSEDKQIGNRFLSSGNRIISTDQFVSKVVFYLWSEIYKDEYNTGNSIFFSDINTEITFSDFFVDGKINIELTRKFIDFNLPVKVEGAENIDLKGGEADDEDGIIENG